MVSSCKEFFWWFLSCEVTLLLVSYALTQVDGNYGVFVWRTALFEESQQHKFAKSQVWCLSVGGDEEGVIVAYRKNVQLSKQCCSFNKFYRMRNQKNSPLTFQRWNFHYQFFLFSILCHFSWPNGTFHGSVHIVSLCVSEWQIAPNAQLNFSNTVVALFEIIASRPWKCNFFAHFSNISSRWKDSTKISRSKNV